MSVGVDVSSWDPHRDANATGIAGVGSKTDHKSIILRCTRYSPGIAGFRYVSSDLKLIQKIVGADGRTTGGQWKK